jgi:hypothetical protein
MESYTDSRRKFTPGTLPFNREDGGFSFSTIFLVR